MYGIVMKQCKTLGVEFGNGAYMVILVILKVKYDDSIMEEYKCCLWLT
jgi:hypothetical protein